MKQKNRKTNRIISLLLTVFMLLGLLPAGIITITADTYDGKTVQSISGYTSGKKDVAWSIANASDLLKFKDAMRGSSCYGETFILIDDVDLNPGWKASSEAPSTTWNDAIVGVNWFGGVFDGQGHTISGLYVSVTCNNSNIDGVGMFSGFKSCGNGTSETQYHVQVKNFALLNSYFADTGTSAGDGVGAIVGEIRRTTLATIENVYTDAIVTKGGENVGGIVGLYNASGSSGLVGGLTVKNCVFAGTASGTKYVGGIVGYANQSKASLTVENCANIGKLTSTANDGFGGIVGRACMNSLSISNCVNLYDLSATNATSGGILGNSDGTTTTIASCYYVGETGNGIGTSSNGDETATTMVARADVATTLAADSAFSTWSQVGETCVSLPGYAVTTFSDEVTEMVGEFLSPTIEPDTSWYSTALTEYEITTEEEFMGFGQLMYDGTTKFLNVTIKLGADINLNSTWTASAVAPKNTWVTGTFQGVFDGQGHSISGIYANASSASGGRVGLFRNIEGATVQNLAILNSYFTGTAGQGVGSICGSATYNSSTTMATDYDKFINIYSEAIVHCPGHTAGGLVGLVGNKTNGAEFENCVFAGTVTSTGKYVGGIVGNGNSLPVTLTDCVNLGTITAVDEVGGIIGRNGTVTMEVTRCVNLGTVNYSGTDGRGGDIVGYQSSGSAVLTDCYWTNRVIKDGEVKDKVASGSITGIPTKLSLINTATTLNNRFGWTVVGAHAFPAYIVTNFGTALTAKVDALSTVTPVSIQAYTGNEPVGTIYTISSAADLLYASELSQSGVEFEGYTLVLGADIDLNPGWSAAVTVGTDNKATLPEIPGTTFGGFDLFRGTFDGQNHTVSGIFMAERLSDSNLAIFRKSYGATIINLKVTNSLVFAELKDGNTNNRKIGGLIANNQASSAVIENCYLDMNVWYRGSSANVIGGVAAQTDTQVAFKNVVFKGVVGNMGFNNTVPSTSGGYAMGGIIAQNNAKKNEFVACDASGVTYYGNDGDGKKVAVGGDTTGAVTTNIDTAATMTAGSASAGWSFTLLPSGATADSKTTSYNADTQSKVYYYSVITETQYNTYISDLKTAGYTQVYTNTVDGNTFHMLHNGAYTVYTSYLYGKSGTYRARVAVSTYDGNFANTTVETEGPVTEKLWQLNVDNWYSKQAGGMGYIIRLSNGKFIVIDGGYDSSYDAKNIYKILSSNNVLGGKPVIAAWFVTHAHDDHFGALNRFSKTYASDVIVEGFYGNFPAKTITPTEGDTLETANVYLTKLAMSAFRNADGKWTPFYQIHTGMNLAFADATALVLYTQEDGKQSYYKNGSTLTANDFTDGNDTSTVIKFTVAGKTIMITGDASAAADNAIMNTWSDAQLKSDIVQVAHHGYDGLSEAFYTAVAAPVALWSADLVVYNSDGTVDKMNNGVVGDDYNTFYYLYAENNGRAANQWLMKNTLEVIDASENACLDLTSYTAGDYTGVASMKNNSTAAQNYFTAKYQEKTGFTNTNGGTSTSALLDGEGGSRVDYTNVTGSELFMQFTEVKDGKFNVRFVVGISGSDLLNDYSELGMELVITRTSTADGSVTYAEYTKKTWNVYDSVIASGVTVTAAELGYDYLYCIEYTDIPSEGYTFTADGALYGINAYEERAYSATLYEGVALAPTTAAA